MFYAPEIRGREHELSPIFKEFLGIAASAPPLTASALLDAWAELDLLRAKTLEEMSEYPVLLVPGGQHSRLPPRRAQLDGRRPRTVEYLDAWRHTQWFNALAAPAAVVPVGRSPEGLPIGVQIVARPFEDEIGAGHCGGRGCGLWLSAAAAGERLNLLAFKALLIRARFAPSDSSCRSQRACTHAIVSIALAVSTFRLRRSSHDRA